MASRTRESLGWGIAGALAFLVLALGYQLVADRGFDVVVLGAVALVVFGASAAATYVLRPRVD